MFLTAHSTVALFLGIQITNPVLAFFSAFLSHFIFDIIPHGDRGLVKKHFNRERGLEENLNAEERRKFIMIAVIDLFVLLTMLFLLQSRLSIFKPTILLALFGAILPDGLQGISAFTRFRFLDGYTKIHHRIHHIIKKDVSFPIGFFIQVITVIVFLTLSFEALVR